MIALIVISFLVSVFAVQVFMRRARRHARRYGADMPQRFHKGHVPRLGGAGIFIGTGVAWLVAGRELLIVTPESLEVRQQIRRFARTKRYDVGLVEDVTGARVPTDEDERPRADFCLRISYDGKHVKVGEGMGEREAEYVASRVLALIRPRTWWGEDERCEERPAAAAKQRSLWGSIVFPAIVIAVLVALAVMSLAPGHRHSTPAASAPRPAPTAPSSPREYASVRTLESLYLSRMNVFGRPRCKVEATWKRWGCTVRAQSTIGPFAGLTLTYRCYSDVDSGPGILCSPVDPPPIND